MTRVSVFGSTGSIGRQSLEVIEAAKASGDDFEVFLLSARSSAQMLGDQARKWLPQHVVLSDESKIAALGDLPKLTELHVGEADLEELAGLADVSINAVVGFAGSIVTLGCLRSAKRLALANKESLIATGPVVKKIWSESGGELIPVDSEHAAVHQCLSASGSRGGASVKRLLLTASGGPFRDSTLESLRLVTREQALAHPTWTMGPKITVDSSTLMNKGLEVIEAKELFGLEIDQIEVVVHRESIVHSMVEFRDGATIGQLSNPDMRLCIGYALSYPARMGVEFGGLDFTQSFALNFEPPDRERFPCLDLAMHAGQVAGTAPAVLSAANEVAVDAFLEGRIRWIDIAKVVERALEGHSSFTPTSVEEVIEADREGRRLALESIGV